MAVKYRVLAILTLFGVSYGGLWTVLEASSYFGLEILKNSGALGHAVLGSLALNVTLIVIFWKGVIGPSSAWRSAESKSQYSGEELCKALTEQFRKMLDLQDFQTILRIGLPLSRALWLEGQYRTRVIIGRIVEEAASREGKRDAQAQALIDDIGWTSVALGQLAEAEKCIRRGIEIAETSKLRYLAAKGYRHLGGIEIQRGRGQKALSWLELAAQAADQIEDPNTNMEMKAGIYYGRAEAYLRLDELENAEHSNLEAKSLFLKCEDRSRAVKTYAQLAKIRERQGRVLEARDLYGEGLRLSEEEDRRDEIIRNHLGLARVALVEGNRDEASRHVKIAKEMEWQTPLVFEIDGVGDQIRELERRHGDDA